MTRKCICDETDTFHESVVATAATYITAGLTPFGAEVIALDMAFQTVDIYIYIYRLNEMYVVIFNCLSICNSIYTIKRFLI